MQSKAMYIIKFNNGLYWAAQKNTVTDRFHLAKLYSKPQSAANVATALIKRRHKWYPYANFAKEVSGFEIIQVNMFLTDKIIEKVDNVE